MLDFSTYDVLTFDCYGTLIDWETGIANALRPVLARHGVSLTDDELLEQFGAFESEAELPPYRTYREVLATVVDRFGERYGFQPSEADRRDLSESVPDWPAFPDSAEALGILARHKQLVILSNVDDELFAGSQRRLQVEFTRVFTAQQIGSYKPNLGNFHYALERLGEMGVPKERVLHVAQSLFHDIQPANQVGLTTVWVNRRHAKPGHGATPPTEAAPDLDVPDLITLARMIDDAARSGA
jgi:2-haloacid dehalogenase